MAKNKGKSNKESVAEEVTYEEEVGGESSSSSGGAQTFVEKNRNFILIAVVAIAGIAIFLIMQNKNKNESNLEASGEMALAEVNFQQDSTNKSINENAEFMGFESIMDEYDGTDASNLAKYYTGTGKLKLGLIDEGISYLEEFEKGDNMVSASAYAALGYAYEQKSEFATAAENYNKASSTPEENAFTTPMYLMDAARNQESAGDKDGALVTYKKIKTGYPSYTEVSNGNVDKFIAKLDPSGSDV